jgi:putative flippase GtrA
MSTYVAPRQRTFPRSFGSLVVQLGKFALVGMTNAGISAAVDAFLLFVGMSSPLAAGTAFAAGAVNGYVLNRRWTFAAADSGRTRIAYVIVQLSGLGCTVILVSAIDSMAVIGHFASYLLASAPVTLAMFFANRAWTFSEQGKPIPSGSGDAHSRNGPQRHAGGEFATRSSRHRSGHDVHGRHRRRMKPCYYTGRHECLVSSRYYSQGLGQSRALGR